MAWISSLVLVVLSLSALVLGGASDGGVTVSGLRCEYLSDPLGIDVVEPRLSWVLHARQRGKRQTAYRILVASGPDKLAADDGDLWDSGKIESSQLSHVVYAGQSLRSQMRCYWKVRLWDKDGTGGAWSEPATWSMGQNMVGWCCVRLRGGEGMVVMLRHAERLNPDGTVYVTNLRSADQVDTVVLDGGPAREFEPHFTYHGFQYVQVRPSGNGGMATLKVAACGTPAWTPSTTMHSGRWVNGWSRPSWASRPTRRGQATSTS